MFAPTWWSCQLKCYYWSNITDPEPNNSVTQKRAVAGAACRLTHATITWQVAPCCHPANQQSPAFVTCFCQIVLSAACAYPLQQQSTPNFFFPIFPPSHSASPYRFAISRSATSHCRTETTCRSLCTLQLHAFKYVTASRAGHSHLDRAGKLSSHSAWPSSETASALRETAVSHLYFLSRYPPPSPPPCRTQRAPITCNRTSTHGR